MAADFGSIARGSMQLQHSERLCWVTRAPNCTACFPTGTHMNRKRPQLAIRQTSNITPEWSAIRQLGTENSDTGKLLSQHSTASAPSEPLS
jgi:hypothetical protein